MEYNLMNDKRGSTFQGWTELMLISVAFLFLFIGIIVDLNVQYNKNFDPSLGVGLETDANSTMAKFVDYQKSLQSTVSSSDIEFTGVFGIVLKSSYSLLLITVQLFWTLISGGWIVKAILLMKMPLILGTILQILYLIAIGYGLLRVLFRIDW